MREIKFRAWHRCGKHLGKMRFEPSMVYDAKQGDCLLWLAQGQDIEVIMQYTGLRDRNGKEIYEGDVVEYEDYQGCPDVGWDKILLREEVTFNAGAFYPVCERNEKDFTVIGNIYEPLELWK